MSSSHFFPVSPIFRGGLTLEHRPGMLMRLARLGAEKSVEFRSIERDLFFSHGDI